MSIEDNIRILIIVILSFIVGAGVFVRHNEETGGGDGDQPRYMPYIHGGLLPLYMFILSACSILFESAVKTAQMTLSLFFGVFINISIYYLLLMIIVPFLRKYINARTCAMLWLLPSYLYIALRGNSMIGMRKPLLVIRAPEKLVWILFSIWLIGFLVILIWKFISHIIFRKRILKDAVAVTNPEILELWKWEMMRARIKNPNFELVISPSVTTPLSVGLFKCTTVVVLPERDYTQDELTLIFRHEIIHIGRGDSWSKFFMNFCTAMSWFNPLMWKAMRKSADDMELSCDETVLLDSDEDTRRRYAKLILCTAGDESGFTTCLSASASALRYRLKNIMKPKKRFSGALTVVVLFFILYMSWGYIALAYEGSTGAEVLYRSRDISLYSLREVTMMDDPYNSIYECVNEEAFHEYMANLSMDNLIGDYSLEDGENRFRIEYNTPNGVSIMYVSDDWIKVYDEQLAQYYLPDGIDWEYLNTLLVRMPSLNVQMSRQEDSYEHEITASIQKLMKRKDGETTTVYESDFASEDPSGFYRFDASEAVLSFSQELAGAYTVKVESWDRMTSYTVSQTELEQPYVIPLAEYAAHYTIYASFYGQNHEIYDVEFRFDVGD